MSETVKDLLEQVIIALAPLLMAALTAFVGMGVRWLQSKTKNERVREMERRLAESVMTIVKSVSGSVVQQIKAARADGKVTLEERDAIKRAALAELRVYWGSKGIDEIKKVLGYADDSELDVSVAHDVEEAVYNMKVEASDVGLQG